MNINLKINDRCKLLYLFKIISQCKTHVINGGVIEECWPTVCVCVCELVTQSCLTLCGPMDCTHQAHLSMEFYTQEYLIALSSSRGSSRPRYQTQVSCNPGIFLTIWDTKEALLTHWGTLVFTKDRQHSKALRPQPKALERLQN